MDTHKSCLTDYNLHSQRLRTAWVLYCSIDDIIIIYNVMVLSFTTKRTYEIEMNYQIKNS
jgi:hypothetical protein